MHKALSDTPFVHPAQPCPEQPQAAPPIVQPYQMCTNTNCDKILTNTADFFQLATRIMNELRCHKNQMYDYISSKVEADANYYHKISSHSFFGDHVSLQYI